METILSAILPAHVGCSLVSNQYGDAIEKSREVGFAKRQEEFRTGRLCAVQALTQAGWRPIQGEWQPLSFRDPPKLEDLQAIVGVGPERCPEWPVGFVGSISHSRHWTWALAGSQQHFAGLGIDTEVVMKPETHELVRHEVGSTSEWALLTDRRLPPELETTLLFSVKESYFKLWYPQLKHFYDFDDVQLVQVTSAPDFFPTEGIHDCLSFYLHTRCAGTEVRGRADQISVTQVNAVWCGADVFSVAWQTAPF